MPTPKPRTPQLYVQFVMDMSDDHFFKFISLPLQRREYLFSLWVQKHYPNKVQNGN